MEKHDETLLRARAALLAWYESRSVETAGELIAAIHAFDATHPRFASPLGFRPVPRSPDEMVSRELRRAKRYLKAARGEGQ